MLGLGLGRQGVIVRLQHTVFPVIFGHSFQESTVQDRFIVALLQVAYTTEKGPRKFGEGMQRQAMRDKNKGV